MNRNWQKNTWLCFLTMLSGALPYVGCGEADRNFGTPDGGITVGSTDTETVDSDTGLEEVFASCDNVISDGFVRLTDAVNYHFTSTIQVQATTVKDATDITFEWGSLTQDFFGRPLNPLTDVDMVLATLWNMTPDLLQENIRMDNLPLSQNRGAIATFPDDAFVQQNLLSFVSPDRSILPPNELWRYFDTSQANYQYPQDQYTFMLIAAHGTVPGKDSRMLQFFHIDPNSENTVINMTDNSTMLTYTTDIVTTMPVPVPVGMPNLVLDWEYMSTNALGNQFIPTQITEIMVAHYPNFTRKQLDDQFLYLKDIATQKWSAEVEAGFNVDLSTLLDASGAATFTGIDNTGVWLAAIFCTKSCNNPAPWAITILQPC